MADPIIQFNAEYERACAVLRVLMQAGYHGRLELSFEHGHPGFAKLGQTFRLSEIDPSNPLAGLLTK